MGALSHQSEGCIEPLQSGHEGKTETAPQRQLNKLRCEIVYHCFRYLVWTNNT